jgi:hypothetical protein
VRGVGSGGAAHPSSLHLFLAERDRIRNSISVVKKDQAQRGHYLGDIVPFGSTVNDDSALVEDAQQQAAIREMIVLKDKGKSLRTVSEIIKKRGIAISHNAVVLLCHKLREGGIVGSAIIRRACDEPSCPTRDARGAVYRLC